MMMKDFVIDDASVQQISEIVALEEKCFSDPWTEQMVATQLTDDRHILLAASADGKLAGYAGVMTVLDEGYISNVATAPEFRRMGVAEALLNELEKRTKERGLSFITLEVRESNTPAITLYEKCGFLTVGLRKNYYEKPRENAILMTKMF